MFFKSVFLKNKQPKTVKIDIILHKAQTYTTTWLAKYNKGKYHGKHKSYVI